MRKAKNIVFTALAILPVLWVLLLCTTGWMGSRIDPTVTNFGEIRMEDPNQSITYTDGSACELIMDFFIPEYTQMSGSNVLSPLQENLFYLAKELTGVFSVYGYGFAPNASILIALEYLTYLFMLSVCRLVIDFISLPIKLCMDWLEDKI